MGQTNVYGRLIDTEIVFAPYPINAGGVNIYTSDADIYHANGWYTIIYTNPAHEEGKTYTETWTEDDDTETVTQGWEEHDAPAPAPTELQQLEERVDMLDAAVTTIIEDILPAMLFGEEDE